MVDMFCKRVTLLVTVSLFLGVSGKVYIHLFTFFFYFYATVSSGSQISLAEWHFKSAYIVELVTSSVNMTKIQFSGMQLLT